MIDSEALANHQLQRLLQAGLATHVIDPAAADMTADTALAALRSAGGDCITTLSDGRIAFSALHPLPDTLAATAHLISESKVPEADQKPPFNFQSRRSADPAMMLVDQLATCLTQTSKGQALISRLTYRFHVMELALSRQNSPDPAITAIVETLGALTARIDGIQSQIAAPPAPQLDMALLHPSTTQQTDATDSILKRLEDLCKSLGGSVDILQKRDLSSESTVISGNPISAGPATLPDKVSDQLDSMVDLQATISTGPTAAADPSALERRLAELSARVETISGQLTQLDHRITAEPATHVIQDNLVEFLNDLRFATAELVASSLKNHAQAS